MLPTNFSVSSLAVGVTIPWSIFIASRFPSAYNPQRVLRFFGMWRAAE